MKKILILLVLSSIQPMAKIVAGESDSYLYCARPNKSHAVHFFWSISSANDIKKWVSGSQEATSNQLVMNNPKNIAWNQIGNPMSIYVLDKKTMRQSGTLLSKDSEILDRWVSECEFMEKNEFLDQQVDHSP